jgi:hypothetical protein
MLEGLIFTGTDAEEVPNSAWEVGFSGVLQL